LFRFIVYGSPDFADALYKGVVRDSGVGPNRLDQLSLTHKSARSLDQVDEDRECLWAELDFLIAALEHAGIQVQRELPETEPRPGSIGANRIGSPQDASSLQPVLQ
jgi:hypothetical protein